MLVVLSACRFLVPSKVVLMLTEAFADLALLMLSTVRPGIDAVVKKKVTACISEQ